ncbi:MAG: hypothetical protein ACLT8E_06425 [Akkermansia sp.]
MRPARHNAVPALQGPSGIIATIGSALYSNGINIDNIAAPADHATREALAVLKTNKPVSDELLNKIAEEIDAISAFSLNL